MKLDRSAWLQIQSGNVLNDPILSGKHLAISPYVELIIPFAVSENSIIKPVATPTYNSIKIPYEDILEMNHIAYSVEGGGNSYSITLTVIDRTYLLFELLSIRMYKNMAQELIGLRYGIVINDSTTPAILTPVIPMQLTGINFTFKPIGASIQMSFIAIPGLLERLPVQYPIDSLIQGNETLTVEQIKQYVKTVVNNSIAPFGLKLRNVEIEAQPNTVEISAKVLKPKPQEKPVAGPATVQELLVHIANGLNVLVGSLQSSTKYIPYISIIDANVIDIKFINQSSLPDTILVVTYPDPQSPIIEFNPTVMSAQFLTMQSYTAYAFNREGKLVLRTIKFENNQFSTEDQNISVTPQEGIAALVGKGHAVTNPFVTISMSYPLDPMLATLMFLDATALGRIKCFVNFRGIVSSLKHNINTVLDERLREIVSSDVVGFNFINGLYYVFSVVNNIGQDGYTTDIYMNLQQNA